jgi:hypothetical protein
LEIACKSSNTKSLVKIFPAAHRHITKNFNAITEGKEKMPD